MAALRRHAAARLDLPRAHPPAGAPDARRAVRRARRVHPRGALVRAARSLAGAALHRRAGDARSARGGVPRRHRVLHVASAPGASSRGAKSTCRGRATSRSPTRTGSRRSCTSCASTSGASARPDGRTAMATKRRAIDRWAPWMFLGVLLLSWELSVADLQDRPVRPAVGDGVVHGALRQLRGDHVQHVADVLDHDGRLRPRHRRGRRPRSRHRVVALHVQRPVPAARRVQRDPEGGVRPDPGRLVRHRRRCPRRSPRS